MKYERLIEKIQKWAEGNDELRAAMILGSRARIEQPADEWSDLDIVLFSTDPARYLENADWLNEIGGYSITFIERTAVGGGKERRVFFRDECEADFSFFHVKDFEVLSSNPQVMAVMRRGYRVIIDKDGLFENRPDLKEAPSLQDNQPLPTKEEFDNDVQDFWYHTIFALKKVLREDVWTAKMNIDGYLKMKLLTMIEWHAKATFGPEHDTWFHGRFLHKWADKRIVEDLKEVFAHYDVEDVQRALVKTMDLYRWVTMETAEKLNFEYPLKADKAATNWVNDHLNIKIES